MHYPCNLGVFRWRSPIGGGVFYPRGRLQTGRANLERALWTSSDTLAARIIVGFNVGDEPTWTIDDLVPIVRRVREAQTGDPSATFIAQHGIYRHRDPDSKIVDEDGAQVLIIDTAGLSEANFEAQMIELAEKIARELKQESVTLEIQRNGITQRVHGIAP